MRIPQTTHLSYIGLPSTIPSFKSTARSPLPNQKSTVFRNDHDVLGSSVLHGSIKVSGGQKPECQPICFIAVFFVALAALAAHFFGFLLVVVLVLGALLAPTGRLPVGELG